VSSRDDERARPRSRLQFMPRSRESQVIEKGIERLLFGSRWLLAPVYLGMSLALVALAIKFFAEVYHLLHGIIAITEADLVLRLLALIDLVLVGSLIVMVMFSGYENFVSKIDVKDGGDSLGWLGKLDASSLKLKVAASIVAISSIHLLRAFMGISQTQPDAVTRLQVPIPVDNDKMMWYVIIHLTFVVSAVMMGVLDRMSFAAHRDEKH
jgi:uncharacterized protein (TIGR00645 family)